MDILSLLTMLGGLALFLYGMNTMGSGLEKLSGGKLERILEKLSDNPIKGVMLGALVTAVIQSSSATTVMVVGFVNSGIMQLNQAIGIIMGANIGTTITSWVLSLIDIEGSSLIVQLFKPDFFAPILGIIGIILLVFTKSGRKKDIGSIFIGFYILMLGMSTMSTSVAHLADVPEFTNILLKFTNPVLGVLVGAVLTAVIQSSSASVGILQALSSTGKITYSSAIPIIMGQNIGTCATALISCIGANKNAKRAAMIHLYFNIIGTVIFLTVFYTCHAIIDFQFINNSLNSVGIAIIHTAFNLLSTLVLLPFHKQFANLARLTIKDVDMEQGVPYLDERFLQTPAFAIEQCRNTTMQMALLAKETLLLSIDALDHYSEQKAEIINENEHTIDMYEDKLGTYLVKLSSKSLSHFDSREVSKLLHTIGDFERISDHAVNIIQVAKELYEKNVHFSTEASEEINVMTKAIVEIVNLTFDAFLENDLTLASQVEPLEQVIDGLKAELKRRHVERLREGLCTIELGFIFSDLINNYERVSDHCSNIAVCIIQISEDAFDTHDYLKKIKTSGDVQYLSDFDRFDVYYTLPHRNY